MEGYLGLNSVRESTFLSYCGEWKDTLISCVSLIKSVCWKCVFNVFGKLLILFSKCTILFGLFCSWVRKSMNTIEWTKLILKCLLQDEVPKFIELLNKIVINEQTKCWLWYSKNPLRMKIHDAFSFLLYHEKTKKMQQFNHIQNGSNM